jgi:hypothetical protein
MRYLLPLLLALLIPFNAAFAAGVGICDVLEGHAPHGEHLGHHAHTHDHDHGGTTNDEVPLPGDHFHPHAHPTFSSLLPTLADIAFPAGASVLPAWPTDRYRSAIPTRLERPPRTAPVV